MADAIICMYSTQIQGIRVLYVSRPRPGKLALHSTGALAVTFALSPKHPESAFEVFFTTL